MTTIRRVNSFVILSSYLIVQSCVYSYEIPFSTMYTSRKPGSTVYILPFNVYPKLQKFCLYNNYVWDLCPDESTSVSITPVTFTKINQDFEKQILDTRSTFETGDIGSTRYHKLYQEVPSNIPTSTQNLFRYWDGFMPNPIKILDEDVYPTMPGYSNGNVYSQQISSYNYAPTATVSRHKTVATNKIDASAMNIGEISLESDFTGVKSFSNMYVTKKFIHALDHLDRTLYTTTYATLSAISPPERQVNGISFALSGLFLQMALIALSTEVDPLTKTEIDKCTGFKVTEQNKIDILKCVIAWLPTSSDRLKFRYANRLVLRRGLQLSKKFLKGAGSAGDLKINHLNGTETPENLRNILNHMVEIDSGGAMHKTFEDDELSEGVCAILISTLYVRARWRSPPTLLNGTFPFNDDESAPKRTARMIRINDIMRYIDLKEWDAEALEIKYATTGLTLFLVVPRGRSLRNLAALMTVTSVQSIADRMQSKRIAATLPLHTLRMTLLLPAKLQTLGVQQLVDVNNTKKCNSLKLSHAVQRIMFWAEAGRNAFKDDGIEWDETPEQQIILDRPYLFYVRWHNVTVLNGNFVL